MFQTRELDIAWFACMSRTMPTTSCDPREPLSLWLLYSSFVEAIAVINLRSVFNEQSQKGFGTVRASARIAADF